MRCSLAEKGKTMARKKKEMDKLARDAAAALAAGMSYGRWKAMQDQPVAIKKKANEFEPEKQICKYCGKAFIPRSYRVQLYCDIYCQQEAKKERNREKEVQRIQAWRENEKAEAAK